MRKLFVVLFILLFSLCGCAQALPPEEETVEETVEETAEERIILGDEQFDEYLPLLDGKRVALFSNQSGIVGNVVNVEAESDLTPFGYDDQGNKLEYGRHILDALIERRVKVTCIFSPEHGFRGDEDAGADISDSIDIRTGVPILSLYSGSTNYPSADDMDKFDVLVVDIQDVGLRYYTYYITMYYLLDACALHDKQVIVLDRPNPNGFYVDGPLLKEEYHSPIGILPLPVVHGLTLGELSQMINGEGWLSAGKDSLDLTVIPCKNYSHQSLYRLIMRPSPNLKDMRAVYLYASTCFFEKSLVSVGRGTDHPFEIYGSPYFRDLDGYDYEFTPVSMDGALYPPFENEVCYGEDLRELPLDEILNSRIDLSYLINAYRSIHEAYPDASFFGSADGYGYYWLDYLSGSDELRKMIIDGKSEDEIRESWQDDINEYLIRRKPYLLYEE